MINAGNTMYDKPISPSNAYAELALPAWMRTGYALLRVWRETQVLQAEMPGIVASELVSAPHIHLHARLRWLPAHCTTFY